MANVRVLAIEHSSAKGALKFSYEYDDVTLALTGLFYENSYPWDADFFRLENEGDTRMDLVFSKNMVEQKIAVTPNKYILTKDPVSGKLRFPSTMRLTLQTRAS